MECTQKIVNDEYNYNYCTVCQCKCVHIVTKNNNCDHICSHLTNQCVDMKKNNFGKMFNILNKTINNKTINNNIAFDNVDDKTNQQIDSLQNQINIINKSYLEIFDEITEENNSAKIFSTEINKINDTLDSIILNNLCNTDSHSKCKCKCKCNCFSNQQITIISNKKNVYTDTTTEHTFVVPKDINLIFITCCGGGGAGGCGFIENMYYYSGGGGGGGASIINRPINVVNGTIIKITVGKGGECMGQQNGSKTIIHIKYPDGTEHIIDAHGGKNGYPQYNIINNNFKNESEQSYSIIGGEGGKGCFASFNGEPGANGNISIPSYVSGNPGHGGASIFYCGGIGGGSTFSSGGCGGFIGTWENKKQTFDNMIGQSGKFGSGGGGSAPKSKINMNEPISGNGGDGIVIIEY